MSHVPSVFFFVFGVLFLFAPAAGVRSERARRMAEQRSLWTVTENRLACTRNTGCRSDADKLDFLVVGDTGGLPMPLYTSYAQSVVANAMSKIAEEVEARFIVNLGDNFYYNGVEDIKDSRFWRSFEDPYKSLLLPWFMIAGNHDHLGNVSAQILHTNRSNLWTFPSLYYSLKFSFGEPETTFEMLLIDTIELSGNCIDVEGSDPLSWFRHTKLVPDHPEDPEKAEKQWQWIEERLRASTADYLFVGGHYPIYSSCEHGPNSVLIARLDPLMRRYGAQIYFSGHDHNLQLLQHTNDTDGTSLVYIVSGAGSRSDRSTRNIKEVPAGSLLFRYPEGWNPFSQLGFSHGGFVQATLRPNNATFTFYSGKLTNKYTYTVLPRTRDSTKQR